LSSYSIVWKLAISGHGFKVVSSYASPGWIVRIYILVAVTPTYCLSVDYDTAPAATPTWAPPQSAGITQRGSRKTHHSQFCIHIHRASWWFTIVY
jgi:hypothetical protein